MEGLIFGILQYMMKNQRRQRYSFSFYAKQRKKPTTNLVIKVAHKKPHLSFPLPD